MAAKTGSAQHFPHEKSAAKHGGDKVWALKIEAEAWDTKSAPDKKPSGKIQSDAGTEISKHKDISSRITKMFQM